MVPTGADEVTDETPHDMNVSAIERARAMFVGKLERDTRNAVANVNRAAAFVTSHPEIADAVVAVALAVDDVARYARDTLSAPLADVLAYADEVYAEDILPRVTPILFKLATPLLSRVLSGS